LWRVAHDLDEDGAEVIGALLKSMPVGLRIASPALPMQQTFSPFSLQSQSSEPSPTLKSGTTRLYKGQGAEHNLINRFIIIRSLVYHSAAHVFAKENAIAFPRIQVHHSNGRNRVAVESELSLGPRLKRFQIGIVK
jgi:hypothetical protein